MHAGIKIRQIRKELGLTQTEFGKRVGVTQHIVSKWENGQEQVSDRKKRLLVEKYGMKYNDFF